MMDNVDEEYDSFLAGEPLSDEKKVADNSKKLYNAIMLDIEIAMRDKKTRVLIREILKDCGVYNVVGANNEPALHAEGRRHVGVLLKSRMDLLNPKLYYEIMSEGVDYEKAVLNI